MAPKTRVRRASGVKAVVPKSDATATNPTSDDLKQVDKFKQVFYGPDLPSSDDDDDGSYGCVKRKGKGKTRKSNKRLKIADLERISKPVAPEMSDSEHDDFEEDHLVVYDPRKAGEKQVAGFQFIAGAEGPIMKLDFFKLMAQNSDFINTLIENSGLKIPGSDKFKKPKAKDDVVRATLVDLPIELAHKIYHGVFVTDEPIDFTSRKNLSRSAALLRVCRKIHDDGTVVLYGHNAFHFRRVHEQRGSYYQEIWTEIGYKDVRRFLNDIGPHNIAKLKHVSFEFEDANSSYTANIAWELRKYVNDGALIQVLDILAANVELERLAVAFRGRCNINSKDYQFLKAFSSIKTRSYTQTTAFGFNHIDQDTSRNLTRIMNEVEILINNKKTKQPKKKGPVMMHEFVASGRRRH